MTSKEPEHALEFLLAFNGRIHWYEGGYHLRFIIERVQPTDARPHGLNYSFSLHDPDGRRILGFDNAHRVPEPGSKFKKMPEQADHWHRTENDEGRPYQFESAERLIDDFFEQVERALQERGVPFEVVKDEGN
jgi:uncharacterized protein DUF6516